MGLFSTCEGDRAERNVHLAISVSNDGVHRAALAFKETEDRGSHLFRVRKSSDERTVMLRQHEEQRQNIAPTSGAPTATASSDSLPVTSHNSMPSSSHPLRFEVHENEPDTVYVNSVQSIFLPRSYKEAKNTSFSQQWQEAIDREISSLTSKNTFQWVPESEARGKKLISSRWVFTTKPLSSSSSLEDNPVSESVRFKARLVARGDTQRPGIDYHEVYAPVFNASTLRAMLSIAVVEDLEIDQMDVVTAFLNAPLEEEIYLRVPEAFTPQPGKVIRLLKSLYGLRQAPRCWNKTLQEYLISRGLQQSQVDHGLYFIPNKLWIAVWVDDFLIMARDKQLMQDFKLALSTKFEMQDLGPIHHFLGMEIMRDRTARTLSFIAKDKVDEILETYGMTEAAGVSTPLPAGCILERHKPGEEVLSSSYPYREVVGSLNYLVTWVRPDLAFAVTQLARHQEKPTLRH